MIIHTDPRDGVALAAFKSERWPASRRNSGRLQIGTPGRLRRNTQHVQDHWPTSLDQAEDRGLILLRRAPTRYAPQLASPPRAPLLATAAGWPLWPATT